MKMRYLLVALLALTFWGCDDNTGSLGIDMMRPEDHINGMVENYDVISQSMVAKKIYAKTSTVYLGKYTDPLFGPFEADFLAQFTCPPDFKFPDKERMPSNEDQKINAELYFYYDGYFGDSLTACKMDVYELDQILKEGDKDNYYTNIVPEKYYDPQKAPLASKTYSPVDMTQSKAYRDSSALGYLNYPNMKIQLSKEFGENIFNSYYTNPSDFSSPENFQNIFKGIYAKCIDGDGAVLYIQRISLRISFNMYVERPSTNKVDSLVTGYATFSTTKEVIQANRFDNSNLTKFEEDEEYQGFTYLKSPGGIFTEATLPIDKILIGNKPEENGTHQTDSINSVSLSFTCYNQESETFKVPNNVLMVRKKDMDSFFENNQVPDNKTSYVSTYSSNKYSFSNIANLVTTCINEKKRTQGSMSDEQWENENPYWNKVVLIPVKLNLDNNNNIIKVEHDLQMNSVKLKGGPKGNPIDLKVIYSRFSK